MSRSRIYETGEPTVRSILSEHSALTLNDSLRTLSIDDRPLKRIHEDLDVDMIIDGGDSFNLSGAKLSLDLSELNQSYRFKSFHSTKSESNNNKTNEKDNGKILDVSAIKLNDLEKKLDSTISKEKEEKNTILDVSEIKLNDLEKNMDMSDEIIAKSEKRKSVSFISAFKKSDGKIAESINSKTQEIDIEVPKTTRSPSLKISELIDVLKIRSPSAPSLKISELNEEKQVLNKSDQKTPTQKSTKKRRK
eukprot:UN32743